MTGANIGLLLAFVLGGLITQTLGWRYAFVFAGLPGLVLAAILLTTTKDPERRSLPGESDDRRALIRRTLARIRLFMSQGANPNLPLCVGGKSPVQLAEESVVVENKKKETDALLEQAGA